MMVITPLIEKVTVSELFPTMAAKDFAHITGEDAGFRARAFYYKTLEDGAEFQEICGGFVPPAQKPGFAVVIGLGRNDDPKIDKAWKLGTKRITCLAETGAKDLNDMIAKVLALRKAYCPALDKGFYCDGDESLSFRIAQVMNSFPNEIPLVMIPGLYGQQSTGFRDYMATLTLYRKVLDRGGCAKLRNAMDIFPKEALTARGETAWEDFPEVTALAFAVHGLMVSPMLDVDEGAIEEEE